MINRPPRDGRMAFVKSPDNVSVELLQKGKSLPIKTLGQKWKILVNGNKLKIDI